MIDFNRAGTPLVEIVTLPDFRSTEEVIEFLKELQRIVRFNNISDADLEKGQMRVDVNISLRNTENDPYGTRVEMKNINSF
jgi:aspartyl-tRNA(Asn)/glutamyl-tRNA(Gln) amidotransferase subunit B